MAHRLTSKPDTYFAVLNPRNGRNNIARAKRSAAPGIYVVDSSAEGPT